MSVPIRILDYFVEHLSYQVNRALLESKIPDAINTEVGLQAEWNITPAGERQRENAESGNADVLSQTEHFMLRLTLRLNQEEDVPENQPYRVIMCLAGLFERDSPDAVDQRIPEADYLKHTLATGISTLYGAAREILASLTSTSPFPKLILPSIVPFAFASRMVDDLPKEQASAESREY